MPVNEPDDSADDYGHRHNDADVRSALDEEYRVTAEWRTRYEYVTIRLATARPAADKLMVSFLQAHS
jgi:hypothetical protein